MNHRQPSSPPIFLFQRSDAAELLDLPTHDPAELDANLYDIRIVNRLAGGSAVVLKHLPRLVAQLPRDRPIEILDLATGSGDIPREVAAWAAREGRPLRLTVTDLSPQILDVASGVLANVPDTMFAVCDARATPFPGRAFDVVLCSLTLHHFAPDDAGRVLREMDRLSRAGFILNDIRRSAAGYFAAWGASRLATRNRLTRHDMPLSVRRAYTPGELRALLHRAGVAEATVSRHPLFRMAAVQRKGSG